MTSSQRTGTALEEVGVVTECELDGQTYTIDELFAMGGSGVRRLETDEPLPELQAHKHDAADWTLQASQRSVSRRRRPITRLSRLSCRSEVRSARSASKRWSSRVGRAMGTR